jgi:hypothetical protein
MDLDPDPDMVPDPAPDMVQHPVPGRFPAIELFKMMRSATLILTKVAIANSE